MGWLADVAPGASGALAAHFRVHVANAPRVTSFRRCLPQHGIDMQKRDARALVVDLDNTPKQENGVPSHDAQRECCPRLHSSGWLLWNSSSMEVAFSSHHSQRQYHAGSLLLVGN